MNRDDLLARVDLRALFESEGLQRRGSRYPCPNPEHDQTGKTPPVTITTARAGYSIWGCHCGAGGSAIDLLILTRDMDVAAAFKHLQNDISGQEEKIEISRTPEPLPDAQTLIGWRRRLLEADRVLTRIATVKGWSREALEALSVGWDGARFTFEIRDEHGHLVNVVRYLPNGKPKTIALAGHPRNLFPAPESVPGEDIVVVEGEPDAVSSATVGLPAVAIPGGWKTAYANRVARDRKRVVLIPDCDTPGRQLMHRVVGDLMPLVPEVRILNLGRDDGWDLGDAIAQSHDLPSSSPLMQFAVQDVRGAR